ncbi:MAG: S49 family peptidase [Candidatus Rokuibacteriota bacterium]
MGEPLARAEQGYTVEQGVAILPIEGVIAKKMNLLSKISGGASTELISRDLQAALSDPAVNQIVLKIDSPGGSVDGTQELAREVREAGAVKPIIAYADGMMASAGYWIEAAADEIYLSGNTAQVGSIGVLATHTDISGAEAAAGVKTTEITVGQYKRLTSQYQPLSDEGRDHIQDQVDQIYAEFVDDIAAFRGVAIDTVLSQMADGRVFIGRRAVKAGLADGVAAFPRLIADMARGKKPALRRATLPVAQAGAGVAPGIESNEEPAMEISKEKIAADHPEIAEALRAEGHAAGLTEGAAQERERIRAVQAQCMPGHEALIEQLKFDGKTTGPEAAVQVLAAEKQRSQAHLADIRAEAPTPLPPSLEPQGNPGAIDPRALAAKARELVAQAATRGEALSYAAAVLSLKQGGAYA